MNPDANGKNIGLTFETDRFTLWITGYDTTSKVRKKHHSIKIFFTAPWGSTSNTIVYSFHGEFHPW